LERQVTDIELRHAIQQEAGRKTLGADGISLEFYRWGWAAIKTEMLAVYNVMFQDGHMTKGQARGITDGVPKTLAPAQLTDYRRVTLLNSDYKIYASILTNRLRNALSGLLHSSQH
jgi:hypothetical protein